MESSEDRKALYAPKRMHHRCHKDAVNYGGAGSWHNWQKFLSVRRDPSEAAEFVSHALLGHGICDLLITTLVEYDKDVRKYRRCIVPVASPEDFP